VIWAYLGPAENKPLLPRIDGFVAPGTIRMLGRCVVPCNWLQIMENSLDPVHTEWLHGHTYEFIKEQKGQAQKVAISSHHEKIAFREFAHGITKHRLLTGQSEECDDWKVGHPIVFPNILSVGAGDERVDSRYYAFQIRVPVDDTHTMHLWFTAYVPPKAAKVPQHLLDKVVAYNVPYRDCAQYSAGGATETPSALAGVTCGSEDFALRLGYRDPRAGSSLEPDGTELTPSPAGRLSRVAIDRAAPRLLEADTRSDNGHSEFRGAGVRKAPRIAGGMNAVKGRPGARSRRPRAG